MELKEFKEKTGGYYTFYRDEEIEKRGYAICYDEICTIDLEELNLFIEPTLGTDNKVDITFTDEKQLLSYVIEGKSIKQRIEELKDLKTYHIGVVVVDKKGNITSNYEPSNCGNVKDYINRA